MAGPGGMAGVQTPVGDARRPLEADERIVPWRGRLKLAYARDPITDIYIMLETAFLVLPKQYAAVVCRSWTNHRHSSESPSLG